METLALIVGIEYFLMIGYLPLLLYMGAAFTTVDQEQLTKLRVCRFFAIAIFVVVAIMFLFTLGMASSFSSSPLEQEDWIALWKPTIFSFLLMVVIGFGVYNKTKKAEIR